MPEIVLPTITSARRQTRTYDNPLGEFDALIQAVSALLPPAGTLIPTAAALEPETGWKLCNGQELVKAEFPTLFQIFSTTFGSTAETFFLPDLRGRMLMGTGASYAPALLGTAGAAELALAIANLPAHSHGITDPGHGHTFTPTPHSHTITDPGHDHLDEVNGSQSITAMGADTVPVYDAAARTSADTTGITIDNASAGGAISSDTTGITVGDTGSGTPIDNLPPVFGINWLVRT